MPRCKAPEILRVASRRIRSDILPRRRVGESAKGVPGCTPQRQRMRATLQVGFFQHPVKSLRKEMATYILNAISGGKRASRSPLDKTLSEPAPLPLSKVILTFSGGIPSSRMTSRTVVFSDVSSGKRPSLELLLPYGLREACNLTVICMHPFS